MERRKTSPKPKKRMSFPKVWAHLCWSPRRPYWWGEEGKLRTTAGAWRGTERQRAGAGGAGWCELSKNKPACMVMEKEPEHTEKLRRRLRKGMGWDGIAEQRRSKRKRHRGTACIMTGKGERKWKSGHILYLYIKYIIFPWEKQRIAV